nr:hypothetical protein [Pandoravirus belohorizontensis]
MDDQRGTWRVVGRGATSTALCRRDRDRSGRAVWRVRCETRRRVPNPRWHGAGPLPLGVRWPGDTRDLAHLVEVTAREAFVPGAPHALPSVDLVVAALAMADSADSTVGCLCAQHEGDSDTHAETPAM